MAFQPVPNTAILETLFGIAGQVIENTYYFRRESEWGAGELASLVTAITPLVTDFVEGTQGNALSFLGIEAKGLRALSDVSYVNTVTGVVGEVTGSGIPSSVALSVARRSATSGRNTRGRVYLPITVAPQLASNDVVASAFITTALAYLAGLDAAAVALDWLPVIVSRVVDGVTLAEADTYPITNWSVRDANVDNQRRRLIGRGR